MHNGVDLYEKRPDGSVKVKLASALTGSTPHKLANTHHTAPRLLLPHVLYAGLTAMTNWRRP
jgi:hypothetical protein